MLIMLLAIYPEKTCRLHTVLFLQPSCSGGWLWAGEGGEGDSHAGGHEELRSHEQHLQGMAPTPQAKFHFIKDGQASFYHCFGHCKSTEEKQTIVAIE